MQCFKLAVALAALVSATLALTHGGYVPPGGTALAERQYEPEYTTSIIFVDVIPAITTSVVFATYEVTVTSCPSTVSSCPTLSASVLTSYVPVSTTVCPVTLTSSHISEFTTSFSWVTPTYSSVSISSETTAPFSWAGPTVSPVSIPSVPNFSVPSDTALPWATDLSSSALILSFLPPSPTSPIAGTTSTSSLTYNTGFTSISLFWPPVNASFVWPSTIISTHSDTITLDGPSSFITTTSTYTLSVVYTSEFTISYAPNPPSTSATVGLPVSASPSTGYAVSSLLPSSLPGSTGYVSLPLASVLPESSNYPVTTSSPSQSSLGINVTTWPSGSFPSTTSFYTGVTTGLSAEASMSLPASSGLVSTTSYSPLIVISVDTWTSSTAVFPVSTGDNTGALPASTDVSSTSGEAAPTTTLTPVVSPFTPASGNGTTFSVIAPNSLDSSAITTAGPVTTGYNNVSSIPPGPTAPLSVFQGVGGKFSVGTSAASIILALVAAFF
ncbi:hypothetical protein MPH_10806 [Macrophomina phaseolina MS6]|uniref:Uncharacterized protein n=1 Tax=Macrophomina phaseolina (strain MS6) TaxID=1126212 RepID=K2S5Y7_MACPH|nr:hypothetical protein MPH_10806 [Macrophomina phaseolina MS6]